MVLQAIKPKNQGKVNRVLNWLIKHNDFNNQRDIADGDGNEKLYNKLNTKCENTYDKFLEYLEELPKYEQNQILKSKFY